MPYVLRVELQVVRCRVAFESVSNVFLVPVSAIYHAGIAFGNLGLSGNILVVFEVVMGPIFWVYRVWLVMKVGSLVS